MEVDFENCGEIMSPSDLEIVARPHVRLPYSVLGQMYFTIGCSKKKYTKLGS